MITRRRFLTTAGALAAAPLMPRPLWAASSLSLGSLKIDILSDGTLTLPGDFILGGMPQNEMREIIGRYGLPTDQLTPPCNVTLLRDGTNTVLFDAGAGHDFMPTAGKLPAALEALGVGTDEITHVLLTHAHPDHLWGLLDDFDDPMFPQAEILIGEAELDYWTDPDTIDSIGEARTAFVVGAQRRLQTVADNIRTVADGEEVLSGIAAHLMSGHTPGHMVYEVRSGNESVMVVGDAIGNHHVAFERPEWASGSDQQPDMAAATRQRLLDQLTFEQTALIGYHLPDGGIGRAERTGDAYRFVAA